MKHEEWRISKTPKYFLPFFHYDPIRSFEKNKKHALLDASGKEVGTNELWEYGKEAFKIIEKTYEGEEYDPLDNQTLIKLYFQLELYALQLLNSFHYSHGVDFISDSTGEHIDFADACKTANPTDLLFMLEGLADLVKSNNPNLNLFDHMRAGACFSVCVLVEIDKAILSIEMNDTELLSHNLGRIHNLSNFNKSAEILKDEATLRAKKAANARHKENREMRQDAIKYYEKNKDKFKSRAAAAREIAKTVVPVYERTIDGWLKDHINAQRARRL